jgi:superfamily I DNA/RNA helicase
MRKLLLLILCILPVLCYSQVVRTSINYSPYITVCTDYYAQSIWKLNNNGTDTKGNNNVSLGGTASYGTTTPAEGTYYADLDDPTLETLIKFFDKYKDNFISKLTEARNLVTSDVAKSDWVMTTVHKAKGSEYDYVKILLNEVEAGFPNNLNKNNKFVEDISSIFYYLMLSLDKRPSEDRYPKESLNNIENNICDYLLSAKHPDSAIILSNLNAIYSSLPYPDIVRNIEASIKTYIDNYVIKKKRWIEELNIYYVAVTRAKKKLDHSLYWMK